MQQACPCLLHFAAITKVMVGHHPHAYTSKHGGTSPPMPTHQSMVGHHPPCLHIKAWWDITPHAYTSKHGDPIIMCPKNERLGSEGYGSLSRLRCYSGYKQNCPLQTCRAGLTHSDAIIFLPCVDIITSHANSDPKGSALLESPVTCIVPLGSTVGGSGAGGTMTLPAGGFLIIIIVIILCACMGNRARDP